MKINFPNDTDKCEQAVPCALMLDIAASIGELTRCFFFLSVFFRSNPYITISHLPLIYICCILIKMSRSQNELGLSLVFLDGEGDHLLFVSCLPIIKHHGEKCRPQLKIKPIPLCLCPRRGTATRAHPIWS